MGSKHQNPILPVIYFQSPITDYRFPVERKDWFSQQDITKKRESIRKLIVRLGPNKQFAIADR